MIAKRRYSFQSVWDFDTPRARVWQALAATPFSWSDWWPQLKDVHDMHLTPALEGSSFSCAWQAPIGYSLQTNIIISQVDYLQTVTLETSGDLVGTVTCRLSERQGHTRIDIDWQVDTTKSWMNRLAWLLKPLFIASHHAVMKSGERGLQKYLTHI